VLAAVGAGAAALGPAGQRALPPGHPRLAWPCCRPARHALQDSAAQGRRPGYEGRARAAAVADPSARHLQAGLWPCLRGCLAPPEVPCAPRVHMRAAAVIESAMLLVYLKSGRAVPPVMHQLRRRFEIHGIPGDLVGSPLTWRRTRQGWRALQPTSEALNVPV